MTIRILEIISAENLHIICKANDGKIYELDVEPLLAKHSNFEGVDELLKAENFQKVAIGEMGELTWENSVRIIGNIWNYDISPEFVIRNAKILETAGH